MAVGVGYNLNWLDPIIYLGQITGFKLQKELSDEDNLYGWY